MLYHLNLNNLRKCIEADSGNRALALYHDSRDKGSPFDLNTMDISMPEMDGTEALQKIREFKKQQCAA
jgi:CheY-like chemotaxis protein